MAIRKSVHPTSLPGIHPGLQQKLREAESAETRGETPRAYDGPQKVVRPTPAFVSTKERVEQVRAVGLVEPAERAGQDGLLPLAEQAPFMPGVDLDGVWDTLSEGDKIRAGAVERFRLEMDTALRHAAMPWSAPHAMGGRLDARNLRRLEQNLQAEIDAYHYLLAPDAYALLLRFVAETRGVVEVCMRQGVLKGMNAVAMYELLQDWVHKLLYQELTSRRRAMGDRGIRRVAANVDLAEQVYGFLARFPGSSPRQRLLMRAAHVHQDLGNVAYAARVSYRGTKLHRAYGARIFTDEMNLLRNVLHHKEILAIRSAVATHSSSELPYMQAIVLALVRAVDHLAPFAPHRVFRHLEGVPGATDYLDDCLERVRAGNLDGYIAAKEGLRRFLNHESDMPAALRDDVMAAFRPFERDADLLELGALAGMVTQLELDVQSPGAVVAQLAPDPFAQKYQALFDVQQEQLFRLARETGVALEQAAQQPSIEFRVPGFGALIVRRAS